MLRHSFTRPHAVPYHAIRVGPPHARCHSALRDTQKHGNIPPHPSIPLLWYYIIYIYIDIPHQNLNFKFVSSSNPAADYLPDNVLARCSDIGSCRPYSLIQQAEKRGVCCRGQALSGMRPLTGGPLIGCSFDAQVLSIPPSLACSPRCPHLNHTCMYLVAHCSCPALQRGLDGSSQV